MQCYKYMYIFCLYCNYIFVCVSLLIKFFDKLYKMCVIFNKINKAYINLENFLNHLNNIFFTCYSFFY